MAGLPISNPDIATKDNDATRTHAKINLIDQACELLDCAYISKT